MYQKISLLFVLVILILSSCKKEVELADFTYRCECGQFNLDGDVHTLTDSHWVTLATEENEFGFEVITGKDYYTTAKIEVEGELEPHHLNMRMSIPSLSEGVAFDLNSNRFFQAHPDSNNVNILIEDINFNSLTTTVNYIVTTGAFELSENTASGTDNISFELGVAPSLDGFTPIGFPVTFIGSFSSEKEEI